MRTYEWVFRGIEPLTTRLERFRNFQTLLLGSTTMKTARLIGSIDHRIAMALVLSLFCALTLAQTEDDETEEGYFEEIVVTAERTSKKRDGYANDHHGLYRRAIETVRYSGQRQAAGIGTLVCNSVKHTIRSVMALRYVVSVPAMPELTMATARSQLTLMVHTRSECTERLLAAVLILNAWKSPEVLKAHSTAETPSPVQSITSTRNRRKNGMRKS